MGPQEKHLTSELAVALVRSSSRAMRLLPPDAEFDLETQRRWFQQAYRDWQDTPRVDLAGRSPGAVIAAERAATQQRASLSPTTPTIDLYTDLPLATYGAAAAPEALLGGEPAVSSRPRVARQGATASVSGWQWLTQRLFGTVLDRDRERSSPPDAD